MRNFAEIPDLVRQRVGAGERVLLILLDAFGLQFLQRNRDHPLVQRLRVSELRSQFPSTTTAHVSTIYFGLPVESHGLYEWNILEPAAQAIICPLRHTFAESTTEGALSGVLAAEDITPGPTFYETLAEPADVFLPAAIVRSPYTGVATRGARLRGFLDLAKAVREAMEALESGAATHCFIYWDQIDAIGHVHGPSSPEFDHEARDALDQIWTVLEQAETEIAVLLTADHGQVDVSPDRIDYLDDLWPELQEHLLYKRPAGSSRDVFLHLKPNSRDIVVEQLTKRLGNRASVHDATTLFQTLGPRLRERLGTIAILPGQGRQAWLRSAAANETWFRGQHGGLTGEEMSTYLAELEQ
jgi:hypothetical protein